MAVYKYKEYTTVVNLNVASATTKIMFLESTPEISIISLRRLIDGGAAILALISRNHNKVILGEIINNPLVRTMLRV